VVWLIQVIDGFETVIAADGRSALALTRARDFALAILDLGLPGIDGLEVLRGLRAAGRTYPVIIVSARDEVVDKVAGLEIGADDYLAKPFSIRELIARVRAVTRRTAVAAQSLAGPCEPARPMAAAGGPVTDAPAGVPCPAATPYALPAQASGGAGSTRPEGLVVDRRTRQVRLRSEHVALTPKEFDLLALLSEDPGAVYTRRQILDQVWDPHFHGPTRTLDVHVATLRRKLGDARWIETVRGVGFRLTDHVACPAAPGAARPAFTPDRVPRS